MRGKLGGILFLLAVYLSQALYEDQAGQTDWIKQNLGTFTHVVFHGQSAYIATAQGAVAGLDLKSNQVLWRRVYGSQQVLDLGMLQLNSKKMSAKKVYTVSALRGIPGGVSVKLWDAQRGGINWEKEIAKAGTFVGSLLIDAAQFGAESTGGILAVAFHNSLHVFSIGKGTLSFTWAGPKDVAWNDIWADEEGNLVLSGLSEKNGMYLATISLDDKKATSVLHVESVGVVASGPVHVALPAGADKPTQHCIAVLTAEKSTEMVVYDVAAMTLEKHPIKGSAKDMALSALGFPASNKVVIKRGSDQTVYELSKGGKTLKKLGDVGTAALQLSLDLGNSDRSLFVGLSKTGSGEGAAYSFIWDHPSAKATVEKVPLKVDTDRGNPVALFVQGSSKKEVSARVLVSFEDQSVMAVHLREEGAVELWCREEALGNVIGSPVSVDIPLQLIQSENDELLTLLGDEESASFASIFSARLTAQARSLRDSIAEFGRVLSELFSNIVQSRGQWLIKAYRGELDNSGYTEAEKSYFGFIKAIIVLTNSGKLFGIHSESGDVIWSHFDARFKQGAASLHLTRAKLAGHLPPELMLLCSDGSLVLFDALTGKVLGNENASGESIVEAMEIPLPTGDDHRSSAVLAMMPSKSLRLFPASVSLNRAKDALEKAYLFKVDERAQTVTGYGVDVAEMKAQELWSVAVPENHYIVGLRAHEKDAVNSPGRKIGAGSLMIKSINPHLIAVASQAANNSGLALTVIDSVTGRLVERLVHKNCMEPVHMVLFENSVIYTSWNDKLKRTDIFALALFESAVIDKFQLNPWNGLPDFLQPTEESSYDLTAHKLVAQQKGFFLNRPIQALGVTQTRQGITQRNVLVGTKAGQVIAVDMRFLDPRRPVGMPSKQEQEEGLISYFGEIPLIPVFTITYSLQVELISSIHTIPTMLESTCLVFVTGLDLFYTRMQPSEGFDLIAEEFNYALLIMMTIGLFIATSLARTAVRKKKLESQWK